MEGQTFQWQQGDEGQTLDLRMTYQQDGTIVIHDLKGGHEQVSSSPDEAINYFRSLFEQSERS